MQKECLRGKLCNMLLLNYLKDISNISKVLIMYIICTFTCYNCVIFFLINYLSSNFILCSYIVYAQHDACLDNS